MVKARLTGVTDWEETNRSWKRPTGDWRQPADVTGGGWGYWRVEGRRMWLAGSMNQQREGGAIFSRRKPADVAGGR